MTDTSLRTSVLATVDRFCREHVQPAIADMERTADFPYELYRQAGELGLFRIDVPEEFGGIGMDHVLPLLAAERIARTSPAFAVTFANCADVLTPIIAKAAPHIAQSIVPQVAEGSKIPCISMSEPLAGSDVSAMRTRATKVDGGYRLNGRKMWCTNGSVGDVFVVFAKTDPDAGSRGISAFLVEYGVAGFERGRDEPLTGLRGNPTSELVFDDVFVPETHRLGAENEGFKIAMLTLDSARLNAAGMALGTATAALEIARIYALQRQQFGKPIFQHQGLQFLIAELAAEIEMSKAVWLKGLDALGRGDAKETTALASVAKLLCTEMAVRVTTECVQIMGANGLSKENSAERLMRDSRAFQIFDGTPQIQRLLIARHLVRDGLMIF
ncbi:acyl-CoA dehydrogenase family protein [Aminobacter carboxidus]|uniref:Acyl-CoA dehydrogenase family protein n=1 Tax=Aminobacter carboxidus TaxID=376165 RepID=A0ABR9GQW0_9HYPH|nr:acyl-CoA dehydrogenase family protein [Aminobacter carboxidus]MBE1206060.1 acyl-CoA dehydrogenase family protein [Aminobacter carboxidus]